MNAHRNPRSTRLAGAAVLALALVAGTACSSGSSPTAPSFDGPASIEASSVSLVNGSRGGDGLAGLVFDPVLSEVARRHSEQMRDTGSFSHQDSGGTVSQRLAASGVAFSLAGENLATVSGNDPALEAHRRFMASVSHRANILEPRFNAIGVGVASDGKTVWITQVFIRQ